MRCCGLFSCLQLVPPAWGPAGKRRGPPSVGMPLLADAPTRLKRYARLPCRCAAAALSGLRRCGGSAGARPLRRGRGCPAGSPVAPGCSPLRLRGCCASLRPRSPLRSAAPPLRSRGGGLRGRLAGRCAPARRPLGGRPAPPRFGALRRGGCRCGGKRESRPCGRLSGKAEN